MNIMNFLAILVAAISNFALGALWYSTILFGKIWQQEEGARDSQIQKSMQRIKPYIYSFIYAVIAAIGFYLLSRYSPSLVHNIKLAIVIGVSFVATAFGVNYQFANRSNKLFLIDAGYHAVKFILYAFIFWYVK